MDYIVLIKDNSVKYTIFEFKRMSSSEREALRGEICCPTCKGIAGYRKDSSDGKAACFFAKHKKDCDIGNSNKSTNKKGEEDESIIQVDTSTFRIKWNYRLNKEKSSDSFDGNKEKDEIKNTKNYSKNPPAIKQAQLSLSQILTYAEINKLKEVGIDIILNGVARDLSEVVHKISVIDDTFVGEKAFFWGGMKYINNNFINLYDTQNVSIFVVNEVLEEFNKTHKVKFFDVVKNNSMIVFGKVIKSKKGNYLIVLDNNSRLYFRKNSTGQPKHNKM